MRAAHIITRLIVGGAQESTILCCEDLIQDFGDEVLLIAGPPLGPEGSMVARVRVGGVPLKIIPSLRRPIHPWRDAVSYRALVKEIKAFRPEVVHTHSGKAGLLGRLAARRAEVPAIIHTVHGAPFHPYQGRGARALFRYCERFAATRCDALISVADAMTELLVAAGVAPREKFTTIHSGFEVDRFLNADHHRESARASLGYTPQDIVVGKVARLFHLKGHEDLIQAVRQLAPAFPDLKVLLVGDGVLRDRLECEVAKAGLAPIFKFAGLVDPEQMPAMFSAMDIVVHTSLREGLARALPQALIAGRPVVSYDIDGAREVVAPGQTGFLVPPRSCGALAEAIKALVVDQPLRARLGVQGRSVADRFRHQHTSRQIRQLYERVLGSKRTLAADEVQHGLERAAL